MQLSYSKQSIKIIYRHYYFAVDVICSYIFYCYCSHVHLVHAAANGVVIATEKKLPSILVDETSVSSFLWPQ